MTTEDLEEGTLAHYRDPALYDHEYRRRRDDVTFYRELARERGAARILELGCGTARLLAALVADEHQVTGVDLSQEMLRGAHARLSRKRHEERWQLLRADMRALPIGKHFDLVICAFNTFQHLYSRADVLAALACVRRALRPGGRFVLDVMNPDLAWLCRDAKNPERRWARTRFRHPTTGRVTYYSTNHHYDRSTQINHIRLYYEDAEKSAATTTVELAHRMFFPEELALLLEVGGFSIEARYGDWNRMPLDDESEQQVLICS